MKVLVTGASGFVGRHVVAALVEADLGEVWAVSRTPAPFLPATARQVIADLLTPGASREVLERVRPSHLVHLAWYAEPRKFWTSMENMYWSAASISLVAEFIRAGGQRVVMAGTCAEYDWTQEGHLEEWMTPRPATVYGAAKNATAQICVAAGRQFDVPVASGRIFWIYGPHESPGRLVSDAARALRDGLPVRTTVGMQRRDFLHVRDVAGAFVAALRSDVMGHFNIASGRAVPVRDMVQALGRVARKPELLELGALPSNPNEPALLEGDTRILRDLIGFSPVVSIEQGIAETYEWWCEHGS